MKLLLYKEFTNVSSNLFNKRCGVEKRKRSAPSVLRNVSRRAKPSEILAIVGPSGAGESTLLEILAGKVTPKCPPTILINRRPVNKSDFWPFSGYVAQIDTLFPLLTVREQIISQLITIRGFSYQSETIRIYLFKLS